MGKAFELIEFQILTAGLFSGDDVKINISYRVQCFSVARYLPWELRIPIELDGMQTIIKDTDIGNYAERTNYEVTFKGWKMPSGKDLKGRIKFYGGVGVTVEEFAEKEITIVNLDDVAPTTPPDGELPAVCTEGQTRCQDLDLYECKQGQWVIKERNSTKCGYVSPLLCNDGDERCIGTTLQRCVANSWITVETNSTKCGYVPPEGEEVFPPINGQGGFLGWVEENKTTIIVVSIIVLVLALVALAKKSGIGVRSPVFKP